MKANSNRPPLSRRHRRELRAVVARIRALCGGLDWEKRTEAWG